MSAAAASLQTAPAVPPLLDCRAVLYGCSAVIGGYVMLLAAGWRHGGTLLGSADIANYDFSVFWGAGRLALAGKPAAAYDWNAVSRLLIGIVGKPSRIGQPTFFYPPIFLLVLAPLAALPFAAAVGAWLAATLAAYLAAIRGILSGTTAIVAGLAAPAVLFNVITGQNGLLTAGLIGGALAMLNERPVFAGVLAGLLVYKPQFAVMLPLFLLVGGHWRSLAAAVIAVAVLFAATAIVFGAAVFADFVGALPNAKDAFLLHQHQGGVYPFPWNRLASVYGMLRALGAGAAPAWAAHVAAAVAAAAASLWLAARPVSYAVRAAAIAVAAFVMTPYSLGYDLAILSVPMAFLVADGLVRGFRHWEIAVLAAAFVMPLVVLGATGTQIGVGPAMCVLLGLIVAGRRNPAGGVAIG